MANTVFGVDIAPGQILIFKDAVSKRAALDALVAAVAKHPAILSQKALSEAVYERESISSTGIGNGIAIPHVRIDEVKEPVLGVGIAHQGIEYESLDNQPVNILVLFATPKKANKEYLGLLAKVMLALRNNTTAKCLCECTTAEEVLAAIQA